MVELKEQLVTVRNLTDIAFILLGLNETVERGSRLATILELLYIEGQSIVDNYCIVHEGGSIVVNP